MVIVTFTLSAWDSDTCQADRHLFKGNDQDDVHHRLPTETAIQLRRCMTTEILEQLSSLSRIKKRYANICYLAEVNSCDTYRHRFLRKTLCRALLSHKSAISWFDSMSRLAYLTPHRSNHGIRPFLFLGDLTSLPLAFAASLPINRGAHCEAPDAAPAAPCNPGFLPLS